MRNFMLGFLSFVLFFLLGVWIFFSFIESKETEPAVIEPLYLVEKVHNYKIDISIDQLKNNDYQDYTYSFNTSEKQYYFKMNEETMNKFYTNEFYGILTELTKSNWNKRREPITNQSMTLLNLLLEEYQLPSFQTNPTCHFDIHEQHLNYIACENETLSIDFEFYEINEVTDYNDFDF